MRYFIILVFFICACKNNPENRNNNTLDYIEINNESLKNTLDRFIVNANTYPVSKESDILLYFYVRSESPDTIIQIINTPPYECENIKGYTDYKNYRLFFYLDTDLSTKLMSEKMLIKTEKKVKDCKEHIDTTYVDMPYEEFFTIKKDLIYPM